MFRVLLSTLLDLVVFAGSDLFQIVKLRTTSLILLIWAYQKNSSWAPDGTVASLVWRMLYTYAMIVPTDASVIDAGATVPPNVEEILKKTNISHVRSALNESRRIINGMESLAGRPYMVRTL